MKKVSYKMTEYIPIELLETKFKAAGIGIAIDSHVADGINLQFYALDGSNLSAEEIFLIGMLYYNVHIEYKTKDIIAKQMQEQFK